MTFLDSTILGIIEGFTEFLPISSTGHLIVATQFLNIEQTDVTKAYEVIIQFAAILAVILNYPTKFTFKHIELWKKLTLAFLPIGIVGFLLASKIKTLFSVEVVAIMFIVGGVVFLMVEKFYKPKAHFIDDVENVSYKQALYIGIAQIFALIPNQSSGINYYWGHAGGINKKSQC